MWRWPPRLLLLLLLLVVAISLPLDGGVVGSAGVLFGSPHDPLFRGLCHAGDVMQSVGTGIVEEMQLRLVHFERCCSHVRCRLEDSLPGRASGRRERGRGRKLTQASRAQMEATEGLREAVSTQPRNRVREESGKEAMDSRRAKTVLVRRAEAFWQRFGWGVDGVRELLEVAVKYPEVQPGDAAERLHRMLDKNRQEMRWHLNKANALLASWAAQAATEERRLEETLRSIRERQRALLFEVKNTAEARLQRAVLDSQMEGARKEWAERQAMLRNQLRSRQENIANKIISVTRDSKILAKLYDDIILQRKQSVLDAAEMNDKNFRQALELILEDAQDGGWERVVSSRAGNLSVERKFMGRDSKGSKFACVRAWCTMDVPAEAIAELFESSERVTEYNKWFLEGRDLDLLDDDTKVVWASSPSVLPFVKPRDFVTVVHVRRLEDGSIVVINRGYSHPDAPPTDEYVRGEVILAANVIRPDPQNKMRAHFTMLTQVDPGGIAPAWIINKISARDPVDFLERVEKAAGRSSTASGPLDAATGENDISNHGHETSVAR